ncbi:hypothetical protein B0H66DRAFT_224786 [Apodospora peruviana]|uniref:Uncharacterized protein n=1 Tax=Apodospora peruviana TaxID=516989 RepID=A0AAE0M4Z7_9PEZI|nr:hypothetical protein B0H66DRAFT_224786 [Apodospora peruviana]
MMMSKFLLWSAILARALCSPLLPHEVKRDETLSFNPGGPMITALSPTTTASSPIAAIPSSPCPAPGSSGHRGHRLHSLQPPQTAPIPINPRADPQLATPTASPALLLPSTTAGCTTTTSPKVASPCFWDGTQTIYPSTTTLSRQVDCHGCDHVFVQEEWWYCPNMVVNATEKVSTPSTYWSTVCAPSKIPGQAKKADSLAATTTDDTITLRSPVITSPPEAVAQIQARPRRGGGRSPQMDDNAACPTTFVVQPEQSAGKTLTRYSKYTTTTVYLDCGGCPLVVSTALAGYGPAGQFTKTTTLPVGITTAYACY